MVAITRKIKTTYKHSVRRMKNFLMLNLVAHEVATKLASDTKFVSLLHLHCCIRIFMHVVPFPAHTITLPARRLSAVCLYKTAKQMKFILVWNMCLLVNELCKSRQIKANKCNSRSQSNTDNTCT